MQLNTIRSLVIGILFCAVLTRTSAQSSLENERRFTLIKVWGFLKYYHPAFASGKLDADSVLILALNDMKDAKTEAQYGMVLDRMYQLAGPVLQNGKPDKAVLFTRNQDFRWINTLKLIPGHLRKGMDLIKRNGYTGTYHRYMPATFHETELPGENADAGVTYPDANWQLVALARYWNAIEYLYPYKYMLKTSWDVILKEQLKSFNRTLTAVEFEKQLLKLNAAIEDSHGGSVVIKNKAAIYGSYFPPFYSRFAGDSLVITDYIDTLSCMQQDIRVGDVIYSIRKQPVSVKGIDWYVSASNAVKKKSILSSPSLMLPLRGSDSVIEIGVLRGGKRRQTTLKLLKPSAPYVNVLTAIYRKETGNGTTTTNDFVLRSVDPDIAMVDGANLSIFYNSAADEQGIDSVMTLMRKHSRAIILDLRCYATQAVFYNKLLPALGRKVKPFMSLKAHSTRYPGAFYEYDVLSQFKQPEVKDRYTGKVILLVDSRTHSQSEMITMILQAAGPAVVVGTQSSGADGDVIELPVPGGYNLSFSGRHVSYPDGSPSQMSGVRRDVKVKLTTKAVADGRDEIFEAALRLLN